MTPDLRPPATAVALLLLMLALPGALEAQTAPAPQGDEDPQAFTLLAVLDQIFVTAQKREEDPQTIPLSVTVLSSSQIEEANVERPEDFIALIPNVSIASSFTVGNSLVTIRGISQINNSDPPVAVLIDGVYLGTQKQFAQELFDVERIEVLKGPQGALYGRNSLGGAINILTRRPGDSLEGFVRAGAGNGSSLGMAGAVRGSLIKGQMRFSLAGSYKESDGFIDNVFLHAKADPYEDTSGRLLLEWLFTDRTWVDLRLSRSESAGGAVLYSTFPTQGFANDLRFPPDESFLGFSDRTMNDASVRFVREGETATLTAITALSDVSEIYRGDADFSNPGRADLSFPLGQIAQGQDLDVRLLSQEIRLASPTGGPLEWIAGAYLLETDRRLNSLGFVDLNGTAAGLFPVIRVAEDNDNTVSAFFGQIGRRLGERWHATLGLRHDEDRRRQKDLGTGRERRATFGELQPKLTLRLQARENLMAYLNASSGFRSGGFNAPGVAPQVFDRETAGNLEIGAKSNLLGSRLRVNGAAYLTRVDNFQFFRFDITRGGQIIDNIRDVEITGIEVDLTARPRPGWDVFASAGLNDTEIRDFDGSGRFIGNQTPSNTRSKLNLGTRYAHAVGDRLLATGRVDLERRGKQYWHPDNLDVQDPVALLNALLGIESGSWSLSVWGKNLTGEQYFVDYVDAAWAGILSGTDLGQPNRPRSYGVEVKRTF
jgi:iron complex outermembrane receptor protein